MAKGRKRLAAGSPEEQGEHAGAISLQAADRREPNKDTTVTKRKQAAKPRKAAFRLIALRTNPLRGDSLNLAKNRFVYISIFMLN